MKASSFTSSATGLPIMTRWCALSRRAMARSRPGAATAHGTAGDRIRATRRCASAAMISARISSNEDRRIEEGQVSHFEFDFNEDGSISAIHKDGKPYEGGISLESPNSIARTYLDRKSVV